MAFELHPQLEAGSEELGRLGGCRLLLKNNAMFPWLLLVPEVDGIEELHELPRLQFDEVMDTTRRVSAFVADYFQPEKLNVACIGNIVRQMHIHIVGRSTDDPAWPAPVWGFDGKKPYSDEEKHKIRAAARNFLGLP